MLQTPFLERTSDSRRRVKGIWLTQNGFTIADICKGKEYFLEKCYFSTSEDVQDFTLSFLDLPTPSPAAPSSILHPPSEVWGYNGNQLIIGVIACCHLGTNTWYIWYRDGKKVKEGNNCCCLIVKSPGSYLAQVHCGEEKATSKPVLVCLTSWNPESPRRWHGGKRAIVCCQKRYIHQFTAKIAMVFCLWLKRMKSYWKMKLAEVPSITV